MPISFACPGCGKALKTKDELAGRRLKCPGCQGPVEVPRPEAPLDALLPEEPPAPKPAVRAPATAPKRDLDALLPEEPPPAAPPPSRKPVGRRAGAPARALRAAGGGGASDGHALLLGGAGGLAAAVLGAFVWYMIAKGANAKIGWIAWGIGWACGFGVATLSGGRGGALLPVLGAATALLGWIIGEYMIFSWHFPELLLNVVQESTRERIDPEAKQAVLEMARQIPFGTYLSKTCDWKDFLFVALAVATGWGVPQKMAA